MADSSYPENPHCQRGHDRARVEDQDAALGITWHALVTVRLSDRTEVGSPLDRATDRLALAERA